MGVRAVVWLSAAVFLSACVESQVVIDAGCMTYGMQRASMPELGMDEISEWVAVTDTAMTKTCRP